MRPWSVGADADGCVGAQAEQAQPGVDGGVGVLTAQDVYRRRTNKSVNFNIPAGLGEYCVGARLAVLRNLLIVRRIRPTSECGLVGEGYQHHLVPVPVALYDLGRLVGRQQRSRVTTEDLHEPRLVAVVGGPGQ
jgi:hypothetical protein